MNEIEVLDLVLDQLGELRIPLKEQEAIQQLKTICQNLDALRTAFIMNRNKAEAEEQKANNVAGCACSSAKEAAKDV